MDNRFIKEEGFEAFTGNELLLKGALEGGAALITGYPGSPVSEVFEAIGRVSEILIEKGIVAQMANNEALSAARLNGARLADLRALTIMKSVGMHVAADGLAIGNLSEPRRPAGGAMVIVGDDPWNETTQINSDSRFLSLHLNMPILEPGTFQELKDWIKDGFELSGLADLYITYVITTNQADGGAVVRCRPNLWPKINHHQRTALSSNHLPVEDLVMIPPHTSLREATLGARFQRLLAAVRERGLNRIDWPRAEGHRPEETSPGGKFPLGFVSSGLPFCYLSQALREMGLEKEAPLLKWGMTYPLDDALLLDFAKRVDQIVVVEEKRDFLEGQMVRLLQRAFQEGRLSRMPSVWGKQFPGGREGIPSVRGINTSILVERLAPLFPRPSVSAAVAVVEETASFQIKIPVRTPTFCPGCPHRDSSTVTKAIKHDLQDPDYMRQHHHGRDPVDVIFHGESGCHSMLQFEPNVGLMQNYSGMGLGGGTGSGIDPFITNKQVVFLGDSTFFHSGMLAVSDSIKNNQDITYIILQNGTTAMTGHQPTPGTNTDVMFQKTFAQDIELLIRGMAKDAVPIHRVNPAYRNAYRALVEDVILKPGVKVIIADKECGITYHRRVRREKKRVIKEQGFLPKEVVINITPEVCEFCLECTNATGCPGLAIEDTLHGPKITTDKSLCVSDGACTKGKVCPSFEEITIHRVQAPAPLPEVVAKDLPPVTPLGFEETWFCYTAGVGGMGAGVVTGILVQAGRLEGYQVLFADKKGLAIRNGGVYGHVVYGKKEQVLAPLVPYGHADLLLGIDILEAARGLDPQVNLRVASPSRTAAVVNTHKMPTVRMLLGKDDFRPEDLELLFHKTTRKDCYVGADFANISEGYFGHKLYANVLLLGAAYQKGLLPLSWENLLKGVKMIVPAVEREDNLRALHLGRQVIVSPKMFSRFTLSLPGYREVLEDKTAILHRKKFLGLRLSQEYRKMVEEAVRWMDVEEPLQARLAQYVYDLIVFENPSYARRYLQRLWAVYQKDRRDLGLAATRAALNNLYRVMIIKDEVYVAHLLTSEEKFRRDQERYRLDPSRGDRVEYTHLNRPQFTLWGRTIEFDLKGRNWQLRLLKHCRFLRLLLPEWHAREKAFRGWYEKKVDGFHYFAEEETYRTYVEILRLPETVRGYRQIRYPTMDAATKKAEELEASLLVKRAPGTMSPGTMSPGTVSPAVLHGAP
jgi:indolepyruvate ferredoxin oxidoreductase